MDDLISRQSADLQPTCNQLATTEGDLISRADAIKCIKWGEGVTDVIEQIKSLPPADRPTVDKEYPIDLIQEAVYDGEACAKLMDMVDRPTGKWEEVGTFEIDGVTIHVLRCKKCGALHRTRQYEDGKYANAKYCPNCGAKMEV